MNGIHLQPSAAVRRIGKTLPWAFVLSLSVSLAYAMNTAALGALSAIPPLQVTQGPGGEVINPCTLDADGALYANWGWWLPAGRSAFCRGQTYPGVAGPAEMATQITRAGRLMASITFVAPNDIRVELYCAAASIQHSFNAQDVAAAEVRSLHAEVCAQAPSN